MRVVVVGGGAAGFFAAITAAECGHHVTILEGSSSTLAKVRISGGGRCNVTHACFDPRRLVESYPRGGRELRGPFSRFQPQHTIDWFAARGVAMKTESDGRMFPTSDDSATIVQCLTQAAHDFGVEVLTGQKVRSVRCRERMKDTVESGPAFELLTSGDVSYAADRLVLATGGGRGGFELAAALGHEIVSPVPSLFTFEVEDRRIADLAGVAVDPVRLVLTTKQERLEQVGPLLITHWGLSGPAVLKLSAWGARSLFEDKYQARLDIDWLPNSAVEEIETQLLAARQSMGRKLVDSQSPWTFPRRLWKSLVESVVGDVMPRWSELSGKNLRSLTQELKAGQYQLGGKGIFKDEFVTCGGVMLKQVDFKTMQSRLCPGLFFAGEILDIDGVTGGFNFQNAWTTAWIAGSSM